MESQSYPFADPESMRRAMRHWVAGVTVVTSIGQGIQHGMTVSSFTSISLIPPMILVSLERATRTYELVTQSGIFGVSILRLEQQLISERFAGRIGSEEDRFLGVDTFSLVSPVPLLACLHWRKAKVVEGGCLGVFDDIFHQALVRFQSANAPA